MVLWEYAPFRGPPGLWNKVASSEGYRSFLQAANTEANHAWLPPFRACFLPPGCQGCVQCHVARTRFEHEVRPTNVSLGLRLPGRADSRVQAHPQAGAHEKGALDGLSRDCRGQSGGVALPGSIHGKTSHFLAIGISVACDVALSLFGLPLLRC